MPPSLAPTLPPKRGTVIPPQTVDAVGNTATAVTIASGLVGSPVSASQLSRSMMIFSLAECTPEVSDLPSAVNPTHLRLGDSDVSSYLGGAVMNHLLLGGVAAVQLLAAKVYQARKGCDFRTARRKVRFPSLLAFFAMFLLEPTSMCCWVTMTHAPHVGLRVVGGVSFALVLAVPLVTYRFVLSERRFGAEFVPYTKFYKGSDSNPLTCPQALSNLLHTFFFGQSKWVDRDGRDGFCQRTRLFFCDYRGPFRWFLVAEMVVAIVVGTLDGIKLGSGKCNVILLLLLLVFAAYIVAVVALRPYNAYFLMAFTLVMTSLQFAGAVLLALSTFAGVEGAEDYAAYTSLACLYLVIGRLFFDLFPKVYRAYKGFARAAEKKRRRLDAIHRDEGEESHGNVELLSKPLLVVRDSTSDETDEMLRNGAQQEDGLRLLLASPPHEEWELESVAAPIDLEARLREADERFRRQLSDDEMRRLLNQAATQGAAELADEDRDALLAMLEAMSEREVLSALLARLKGTRSRGARSILDDMFDSGAELSGAQLMSTLQHTRGLEAIVLRQKILERERQAQEAVAPPSPSLARKATKSAVLAELDDILDELERNDSIVAVEKSQAPTLERTSSSLVVLAPPTVAVADDVFEPLVESHSASFLDGDEGGGNGAGATDPLSFSTSSSNDSLLEELRESVI